MWRQMEICFGIMSAVQVKIFRCLFTMTIQEMFLIDLCFAVHNMVYIIIYIVYKKTMFFCGRVNHTEFNSSLKVTCDDSTVCFFFCLVLCVIPPLPSFPFSR